MLVIVMMGCTPSALQERMFLKKCLKLLLLLQVRFDQLKHHLIQFNIFIGFTGVKFFTFSVSIIEIKCGCYELFLESLKYKKYFLPN